jgi:hypothetical protein
VSLEVCEVGWEREGEEAGKERERKEDCKFAEQLPKNQDSLGRRGGKGREGWGEEEAGRMAHIGVLPTAATNSQQSVP